MLLQYGQGDNANGAIGFQASLIASAIPESSQGSATPTFTRASTKSVIDFEGRLVTLLSGEIGFTGARRVRNLIINSETLTAGGGWTLSNCTTTAGVDDPNGGTTAYTVTATGVAQFLRSPTGIVAGRTYVNSVWLRRRTGTGAINLFNNDASATDITASVTSSWRRFSVSGGGSAPYFSVLLATSGDAVDMWHPQAEDVTGQSNQNPSEYVSVGVVSSPFFGCGVDGVQCFSTQNGNTVASNVVTAGTGAVIADATLKGYSSEGAMTQLALDPRDMTTANWTLGATMTRARTSVGWDGAANTATRLTGGAVAATNIITQTLVAAATSRTYSVGIKRVTGTGAINITQDAFATSTNIASQLNTSTFTQVQLNQSQLNAVFGIQIATNGDAIDCDFNGFEAGAFATSPGATRNADLLSYASSGNVSAPAFSVYAEYSSPAGAAVSNHVIASLSAGGTYGAGNGALLRAQTPSVANVGGNGSTASVAVTGSFASPTKVAGYFNTSGTVMRVFAQGTAGAEVSTLDWTGVGTTSINIGNLNSTTESQHAFGNIRNIRIYTRALSNAQLQAMTSP